MAIQEMKGTLAAIAECVGTGLDMRDTALHLRKRRDRVGYADVRICTALLRGEKKNADMPCRTHLNHPGDRGDRVAYHRILAQPSADSHGAEHERGIFPLR